MSSILRPFLLSGQLNRVRQRYRSPEEYPSALIQALLDDHHIQVSMSGVGNCYDNAPMESFFGRLKAECALSPLATRAETRLILFEHLEVWYNRQRLHSSLGYLSPAAFEQRYYETNTVR